MDGVGGLHGWQWLFLVQGLPAFFLAFSVLKFLPDRPAHAAWLSHADKNSIATSFGDGPVPDERSLWKSLCNPYVLALGIAAFAGGSALYGNSLWLPQIVHAMGFSNRTTGFVSALPYVAGMGAMILWGRSSDRSGERIRHIALAWLLAAAGFALSTASHDHALTLFGLTLAIVGVLSAFGPFYSMPSSFLTGPAAAGGIALINSIANLGGFCGPVLVGILKERTGGYTAGFAALGLELVVSALIVLAVGRAMSLRTVTAQPVR